MQRKYIVGIAITKNIRYPTICLCRFAIFVLCKDARTREGDCRITLGGDSRFLSVTNVSSDAVARSDATRNGYLPFIRHVGLDWLLIFFEYYRARHAIRYRVFVVSNPSLRLSALRKVSDRVTARRRLVVVSGWTRDESFRSRRVCVAYRSCTLLCTRPGERYVHWKTDCNSY